MAFITKHLRLFVPNLFSLYYVQNFFLDIRWICMISWFFSMWIIWEMENVCAISVFEIQISLCVNVFLMSKCNFWDNEKKFRKQNTLMYICFKSKTHHLSISYKWLSVISKAEWKKKTIHRNDFFFVLKIYLTRTLVLSYMCTYVCTKYN